LKTEGRVEVLICMWVSVAVMWHCQLEIEAKGQPGQGLARNVP